jgi:hypothetical protein
MVIDRDLAKAFIIVQGNRIARGRRRPARDLGRFEVALGTGLRAGAPTALWFEPQRGLVRLPFAPWLAGLLAEGLRDIDLVPAVPHLAPTTLVLDLGPRGRRVYDERWEGVPVPSPDARALLAFVARHPGEGLEERTAHYARELGLIGDARWAEVERACTPSDDELWIQAFALAQSHVDVREETAADWEMLMERGARQRTSGPALVFAPNSEEGAAVAGSMSTPSVSEARASLEQVLHDNLAVARSGNWTAWIQWFAEALDRLQAPPAAGDPWLLVTSGCGVPPDVPSLARATQKSHVFGGMGSWNDVPCDNAAERERLWSAMHDAWRAVFTALHAYAAAN